MKLRVYLQAMLAALLTLLLAACGGTYRSEEAQRLSNKEAAILDWDSTVFSRSTGCFYCIKVIDGVYHPSFQLGTIEGGTRRAMLKPGLHTITYHDKEARPNRPSPLRYPASGSVEINMKAGHVYKLKRCRRKNSKACCSNCFMRSFIWIEDQSTGEIVGGYKDPACDKPVPLISFCR